MPDQDNISVMYYVEELLQTFREKGKLTAYWKDDKKTCLYKMIYKTLSPASHL